MLNYFQFVKDLSLKNNVSFKAQLMNPESKKLYKLVKPKKVRVKKLVQKFQQEEPKGVKVDLARAVVPVEAKPTDEPLNFFNQRWLNFVNTIPYESYRDEYAIDKRPKDLKPYNLDKLRYLLYDVKSIIEHSPLSYELSSYCLSPYILFPGKRALKLYRHDKYTISRKFKDINLTDTTYEFNHDYNVLAKGSPLVSGKALTEQIETLAKRIGRNASSTNLIYINDMMLSKRDLYTYIFLYGSFLTTLIKNKNKSLIVACSFEIGDGVDGFYKRLDKGYFNSTNFDFGINGVTGDFNFSKIANYLAGQSSGIPVAKILPKNIDESPIVSEQQVISSATAYSIVTGNREFLNQPLPRYNIATYPTLEKEFSQRIYFIRGELLSNKTEMDPRLITPIGSYIYFDNGYISEVINYEKNTIKVGRFKDGKKSGPSQPGIPSRLSAVSITKGGKGISYYRPIKFVLPQNITPDMDYTSLKNMAIANNKTYREVYESLKPYWTDQVDDSNYRGDLNSLLQFDKPAWDSDNPSFTSVQTPEFNESPQVESTTEIPVQTEEEPEILEGGSLEEEDLVTFLSIFDLKGCDIIGDIGNNQKAYLLSF